MWTHTVHGKDFNAGNVLCLQSETTTIKIDQVTVEF